jgi:hypothetical protein
MINQLGPKSSWIDCASVNALWLPACAELLVNFLQTSRESSEQEALVAELLVDKNY